MIKPYIATSEYYYDEKLIDIKTTIILSESPIKSEVRNGPWKEIITYQEATITMAELMTQDAELVIQYLKERGITTCPMNF